jgi:hypothetical protein
MEMITLLRLILLGLGRFLPTDHVHLVRVIIGPDVSLFVEEIDPTYTYCRCYCISLKKNLTPALSLR